MKKKSKTKGKGRTKSKNIEPEYVKIDTFVKFRTKDGEIFKVPVTKWVKKKKEKKGKKKKNKSK